MKLDKMETETRNANTMDIDNCSSLEIVEKINREDVKVAEAVGIDFKFGLHSLRKTFGYMYILNGGNIITLMKMYNHDEPSTTLLYVMWNREDAEREREAVFIGGKK